jgi:hypothetical protein
MTSVIPIAATRLLKTEPYEASRSRSRKAMSCLPRERFNYLLREPPCRVMEGRKRKDQFWSSVPY